MSAAPVDCLLRSHPVHAGAVVLTAAASSAAMFLTRLPPVACLALSILLLLAVWAELREHAWRTGPRAARRVRVDSFGWWLHAADGTHWGPARPVAGRVWTGGVMLVLRDARGARRRLLVLRGALSADDLRRLRVRALALLGGRDG